MICSVCGKEFERIGKTGRPPKVCSPECRGKRDRERYEKRDKLPKERLICAYCEKPFETNRKKQRFCSDECRFEWRKEKDRKNPLAKIKICEVCGKEFPPAKLAGGRQRFCSEDCSRLFRAKKKKGICIVCGREYRGRSDNKGFCSRKCVARYSVENKQNVCVYCGSEFKGKGKYCCDECLKKSKMKQRVCLVCGKEFYATNTQMLCSDECRRIRANQAERQTSIDEFVPKMFVCKECGVEFRTEYGKPRTVFCSDECARKNQKRASKAVRRARKKGLGCEVFDPLDVFKRDRWTCQLCGVKTPKNLRGTCNDEAPELDHIIPLALGGEHSMRNTQCLCRKCNRDKGATAQGQLRIA
jgi:predicted nucleic acid-binding Zn ribbon protein